MQPINIERLLIRFLKEKNIYHLFNSLIKESEVRKAISEGSVKLSSTLFIKNLVTTIFYNKNSITNKELGIYNYFIDSVLTYGLCCDFIKFMSTYCIKYTLKFINEKNILSYLNYNIANFNTYKNLKEYMYYFIKNNFNIFDFFNYAFSWTSSKEGYYFWSDVENDYYAYMNTVLTS